MNVRLKDCRLLCYGFSLVEMLMVCGIFAVLLALVTPAAISLISASRMNSAVSMLNDELNLARQAAMTENRDVEVRFYRVASNVGGEGFQYRAFRTLRQQQKGDGSQLVADGPVKRLPGSVILSANAEHSTLLDYANPNRSGLSSGQEDLPGERLPSDYVGLVFKPDGGTSLNPVDLPEGNWFLTLFQDQDKRGPESGLPANFCTLQIEPITGRSRVYRP
ncbi:Verru_Chthon cassette protein D [Phragmitibacter flavus]|uniref:Verru_Chthon cassette protein D n=1 Tax=Phragmitibacter flavus TaxID=2576071 RepID=A0A5R8KG41_9BACT|nr:Verru_Chthon cassette protein D [Phragmitibacter flavus]TLD71274.1 Verru_Chthon cassette protein D [Phragmitibacter flavus]